MTTFERDFHDSYSPLLTIFNSLEEKEGFSYCVIINSSHELTCKYQQYFEEQKSNDLIIYPHYNTKDSDGVYKSGRSFFHGMTFGYKKRFNKRWAMELFIGGGYAISFYKGYDGVRRVDFENDDFGYRAFNLSGEVLLYRGGLMLVYKLLPYKEKIKTKVFAKDL